MGAGLFVNNGEDIAQESEIRLLDLHIPSQGSIVK